MTDNRSGVPFCSCSNTRCPNHPCNHDQGCTPCIAKNLRKGEIPSCFFTAVSGRADQGSYYYKDFAAEVMKAEQRRCGAEKEKA